MDSKHDTDTVNIDDKKMIEKFLSPNLMIKLGTDNHIYENLESGLTFINIDAPTVGTIQTRTCHVTKPII
jgi:hypothetical protein